jgi:hypothetical protein
MKSKNSQNYIFHKLDLTKEAIYNIFNQSEACLKCNLFFCNPDPSIAVKILNLIDNVLIKIPLHFVYPSITQNSKIYVPSNLFVQITVPYLQQLQNIQIRYVQYRFQYDSDILLPSPSKI